MEEIKADINFAELEKYKNLVNLEVSKYPHFNFGGPELEPSFENVIWLQVPPSWTVEEIAKFTEDYGDVHIVKDSLSSAFVEFKNIYAPFGTISKVIEKINSGETNVRACLHKDAKKYKAGVPLAYSGILFTDINTGKFNNE